MRLPPLPPGLAVDELPLWPPLLATRGPGGESAPHAHHALHVIACMQGSLQAWAGAPERSGRAAGVLTAPDVPHAIDARGTEVVLVFLEPESAVGRALTTALGGAPMRLLSEQACAPLREADPLALMRTGGEALLDQLLHALGAPRRAARPIHPRVRALLRHLRERSPEADTSLEALAEVVALSPGRLMHAFTESIGVPLRPYLAWLRTQRAAAAISAGASLSEAAHAAGFADAAHMTRTFRRTFGMTPSMLRGPR